MTLNNLFFLPSLPYEDNRIYKIFNIAVLLAIIVVTIISTWLLIIGAISSFFICLGEIVIFSAILLAHLKGHFIVPRYVFFVCAMFAASYGSLYHGENGGYDFSLLVTALAPVLFFKKRAHYLSLFFINIFTFIAVKVLYDHIPATMPVERQIFPYYWNVFSSGLLIYFGFDLFKSSHLRYEKRLKRQNDKIGLQKEALMAIKEQLESLLEASTKKIEEQNQHLAKYAYLNAHKARSPLARILGLVNLTKYEDLNSEEKREFYFNNLKLNANDLDEVLKEISGILNENIEDEAE
ncbi:MAG: hypothetical protein AAFX87_16490 [Bacteroidota bacterium]